MKYFISALLCLSLMEDSNLVAQTITLKGNIVGTREGYNKMYFYGTTFTVDSTTISNNSFEFNVPFIKPGIILVCDEYNYKTKDHPKWYRLVTDKPGILFLKDVDLSKEIEVADISGNQAARDFQELKRLESSSRKAAGAALRNKFGDNRPQPGSANYKEYLQFTDSLWKINTIGMYTDFVKSHPDSYATIYMLNHGGAVVLDTPEGEAIYHLLSPAQQNSEEGKRIAQNLQGIQKARVGRMVTDFTLLDVEGRPVVFSSLKGKYVLLDFWASFCAPCIAEFPRLKELYKKYKGEKFDIYTISVDGNKASWVRESKKQNFPWLSALDTKNISGGEFAVGGIPDAYLIDPDGKILLRATVEKGKEDIIKKIEELFGSGK